MRLACSSPTPRRALVAVGLLALGLAAAETTTAQEQATPAGGRRISNVAVFPVENLTGGTAPADVVRRQLVDSLVSLGVRVLGDEALDAFMTRHRVRYAAGVDGPTGRSLRAETGVDAVLIASIELSSEAVPPKVALIARLVSVEAAPQVVWAEDAGLAGDDAPGLFGLGLVDDHEALLMRALDHVAASLGGFVRSGSVSAGARPASKFRPKSFYRRLAMEPGRRYSVAVVPFVNATGRRDAGEILALLFARHLSSDARFLVVDAGTTRRQLLDARIIMDGGPSITDAESVAAQAGADLVLGGRVFRYEDYEGPIGRARVQFSTVVIERKSGRVVWSSDSSNDGDEGVGLFERGTSRTAHAMATQMVRLTAEGIAGRGR